MTAGASLLVLAASLLVLVVPGASVMLATRPESGVVRAMGLAPAASVGLVWVAVTALRAVGAPIAPWTILPWLAAVTIAAGLVLRRRHGRLRRPGLLVDRWDALGLASAAALGMALMWWGTDGLASVPPNDDGAHHGLFVARILATRSLDVTPVFEPSGLESASSGFYPFGLHVAASLLASPGPSIGVALNAAWTVVAVVSLPFGMFALARRTFPFSGRAALAVAVVSVLWPQLPVGPTYWGGLPLIAGMAMAPALVDGVLGLMADPARSLRAAAVSGAWLAVAAVGLAFTHSSEVVTVALLVVVLGLLGLAERSMVAHWRQGAAGLAGLVLVALLLSAPWLASVGGRATEEADPLATLHAPSDVLRYLVGQALGPSSIVIVSLLTVVVGVVVALRRRSGWGWLGVVVVVAALAVSVASGWPLGRLLTAAWYSHAYRVALILVCPVVAFVGLGSWWLARAVRRRLTPAPLASPRLASVLPAVLALALVAAPVALLLGWASAVRAQEQFAGDPASHYGGSLATADARTSWRWLSEHTDPEDLVLNQFADGSGWMYAFDGLVPVFPRKVAAPLPGDAGYLFDHAADLATDARAQQIARDLHVRFAYVGSRIFPDHDVLGAPLLPVGEMIAGGWRVVLRTPSTVVLEVPAGV